MGTKSVSALCLALLLLMAPVLSRAQSESLEDLLGSVEEIVVVTATKTEMKITDAPASVTVITRADLERYGYRRLTEALARVPEVYAHYNGHGVDTDFRGFFTTDIQRRILFMIDGHRLNDRFHFGDFDPDVIRDLSNVERIEVVRGPGSPLYGNVAVLGVVNIITRKGTDLEKGHSAFGVALSADELGNGSFVKKYQADFRRKFSDRLSLSLNVSGFGSDIDYDTRTTWHSSETDEPGVVKIKQRTDAFFGIPDTDFQGGKALPNVNLNVQLADFTVGGYLHTYLTSRAYPLTNQTIGHPDNDYQTGAGAVWLQWEPQGALKKYQPQMRLSYSMNLSRGALDFSTADKFPNNRSLFESFFNQSLFPAATPLWLKNDAGQFYNYTTTLDRSLMTDAAANANGGGGGYRYAGVGKSVGLEFQFSPYQTERLSIMLGGNYENAEFENQIWGGFRNGKLIGEFTSLADDGRYGGVWGQAIWQPAQNFTAILGVRYDYQNVADVHRHIDGRLLYGAPKDSAALRVTDRTAEDVSPRLALNYRFSDRTNVRLIYSQAFRAVPPQEIIRLDPASGNAESEKTDNFELIVSSSLEKNLHLSINLFTLKNNVLYQWNPEILQFAAGSSWRNTGGSMAIQYTMPTGLELWANSTFYELYRPSDAVRFMQGIPNFKLPLDSPAMLFKAGASYRFSSRTTLAGELYYNGQIKELIPTAPNSKSPFVEHRVPESAYLNATLRQDLDRIGVKGLWLEVKVNNLLDSDVNGVLNVDSESSWLPTMYEKPHQLPDFGRRIFVQLGYAWK